MSPYELVYEYALNTSRSIFLTGKAGTGKTTLLRRLCKESMKSLAIVAPTGVAAINARGVTIHSFFQLPPQMFLPTDYARKQLFAEMQMRGDKQQVIRNLELLIIDEVSMVRADLLDAMDAVLRKIKRRHQLPFGGVQVLFIGDLFQLSPIVKENEWGELREYYDGPYFFQSRVFREINPIYIELDKVFRQSNRLFVDILNEVRNNALTEVSREYLNARYQPDYDLDKHDTLVLSTHNRKVDAINERKLSLLDTDEYTYEAHVQGTFSDAMYPMDTLLRLKVGAKVIFTRNDSSPEHAYYNGRLATVSYLDKETIRVVFDDGSDNDEYAVHQETWENIRYVTSKNKEDIKTEVVGTFTHFPLRLAWAITIHKSQGLTFDNVVIDVEESFAAGQVYVALSRCRSLEGITLLSPISALSLNNAREVLAFTDEQSDIEHVEQQLPNERLIFLRRVLFEVFDFKDLYHLIETVRGLVKQASSFNQVETIPYLGGVGEQLAHLHQVGESFQRQIHTILLGEPMDMEYLKERLHAAYVWFEQQVSTLLQTINDSPAYTDNKDDAKGYQEKMEELYVSLSRKLHLMKHLADDPSVVKYFEARARFRAPSVKIVVQGTEINSNMKQSEHPVLLRRLFGLRKQLAEEKGVEPYLIFPTKTLIEISNALPTSKREMLKVSGVGAKRYQAYGEQMIRVVQNYVGKTLGREFIPNTTENKEQEEGSKGNKKRLSSSKKKSSSSVVLTEGSNPLLSLFNNLSGKSPMRMSVTKFRIMRMVTKGSTIDQMSESLALSRKKVAMHLQELLDSGMIHFSSLSSADREYISENQMEG